MPVSRLRLRLTGLFALTFATGLVVLGLSLFIYLRERASTDLTADMLASAGELARAIDREARDPDNMSLESAVTEALKEWPRSATAFLVRDSSGRALGSVGATALLAGIPGPHGPDARLKVLDLPIDEEGDLRVASVPLAIDGEVLAIVAAASTANLQENQETLKAWMLVAAPLVLILSLIAGYALSRFALRPIHALGEAAAAVDPARLTSRLPVREPPDEIDRVAGQFNGLLDRLQVAQSTNQSFLRQAAHQIRTPLTLVLGESELALGQSRSPQELKDALQRIQRAAEQIKRRVSDLFLLAQAEAGEYPALRDLVELDQVVLEVVDLFRARAAALGQSLELGSIDEAEVRGDRHLLHEAAAELLENACRHSNGRAAVWIAVHKTDSGVRLEVENTGSPVPTAGEHIATEASSEPRGLGLAIVRWIAKVHSGTLSVTRSLDRNQVALELPLVSTPPA